MAGKNLIRQYRRASGMTQRELSVKAKISYSMITKLESGEQSNPSLETLKKIADALDCSVSNLLSDEKLTVGENLRIERRKAGLTQKALSDLSGIPVITIQGYESDKFTPKYSAIQKLCAAMSIPCSSLLPDIYDLSNYSTLELIQELERRERERL